MRSRRRDGRARRRRPDRPQHGLPGARRSARPARAPRCSAIPTRAVAVARAAREGSGLPVTVKLRAGRKPGEREGVELAHRLVEEAGVAGITFHPRSAAVRHKGTPDYDLAASSCETLPVPVIVSGGLDARRPHPLGVRAHRRAAVMLARGSLGNPWLFAQLLGDRDGEPDARGDPRRAGDWVIDRADEHLGRGARRPLPAQVPSVVRRAPRRADGRCRTRCSAQTTLERAARRSLPGATCAAACVLPASPAESA